MDPTTEYLSDYACRLTYEDLSPEAVHQVKRTLVDTLGCGIGAFDSEPASIARRMASRMQIPAVVVRLFRSPPLLWFRSARYERISALLHWQRNQFNHGVIGQAAALQGELRAVYLLNDR